MPRPLQPPGQQPRAAAQLQNGDALPAVNQLKKLLHQLAIACKRIFSRLIAGQHIGVVGGLPAVKGRGVHALFIHTLSSISSVPRPPAAATRAIAPLIRVKAGFTWPMSAFQTMAASPSARRMAAG